MKGLVYIVVPPLNTCVGSGQSRMEMVQLHHERPQNQLEMNPGDFHINRCDQMFWLGARGVLGLDQKGLQNKAL